MKRECNYTPIQDENLRVSFQQNPLFRYDILCKKPKKEKRKEKKKGKRKKRKEGRKKERKKERKVGRKKKKIVCSKF